MNKSSELAICGQTLTEVYVFIGYNFLKGKFQFYLVVSSCWLYLTEGSRKSGRVIARCAARFV